MYVLRQEPDDQVSLCAYLIWRERHERGCTVEEAFEQAKAAYAARDAEVEAFTAALIEECREPDLPLTEAEHAYWDAVAAEAEAHAAVYDRD